MHERNTMLGKQASGRNIISSIKPLQQIQYHQVIKKKKLLLKNVFTKEMQRWQKQRITGKQLGLKLWKGLVYRPATVIPMANPRGNKGESM